jgi:hypothetical protein
MVKNRKQRLIKNEGHPFPHQKRKKRKKQEKTKKAMF